MRPKTHGKTMYHRVVGVQDDRLRESTEGGATMDSYHRSRVANSGTWKCGLSVRHHIRVGAGAPRLRLVLDDGVHVLRHDDRV